MSNEALQSARAITSSLRRSHQKMSSSLGYADEALSLLQADGQLICDTHDIQEAGIRSKLRITRKSLNLLFFSQKYEKMVVLVSWGILWCVVIYIIGKRIRIFWLLSKLLDAYRFGSQIDICYYFEKFSPSLYQNFCFKAVGLGPISLESADFNTHVEL